MLFGKRPRHGSKEFISYLGVVYVQVRRPAFPANLSFFNLSIPRTFAHERGYGLCSSPFTTTRTTYHNAVCDHHYLLAHYDNHADLSRNFFRQITYDYIINPTAPLLADRKTVTGFNYAIYG